MHSLDLMKQREEEIGRLVQLLSNKTDGFSKPKLVVIGGYALRAHVPFARYSRDCDFALKDGLSTVRKWLPEGVSEESLERRDGYGFLRWSKPVGSGKRTIRVGVDFMEGQVVGREGEAFSINDRFLDAAETIEIQIGTQACRVFVPTYADLLVMKVVSARRSDVRDVAALVWQKGVPDVQASLSNLNDPTHFFTALEKKVIPEIKNKHFLDSWRGMFATDTFKEEDRREAAESLKALL